VTFDGVAEAKVAGTSSPFGGENGQIDDIVVICD
jgi:hypothetical protein